MSVGKIEIHDFLACCFPPEESRAQGVIIDVRSQSEFEEAHIPGAVNIPLLDDAERAEVGTIYKQVGAEPARKRGLQIVQPKMRALANEILRACALVGKNIADEQLRQAFDRVAVEILGMDFEDENALMTPGDSVPTRGPPASGVADHGSALTFYCWRGGARSKSMALMAATLGLPSRYLAGGHKEFRRHALSFLNRENYPFKLCTLYGLTGSGKTQMIRRWANEGKPVVDLEKLAYHRGSAFGQVGIDKFGGQKDFENHLFWELNRLLARGERCIVVEGESRRIGRCQLPENFMTAMRDGFHVRVNATTKQRVRNIMEDYVKPLGDERLQAESRRALDAIRKKLGGEKHAELSKILAEKDYARFTEELLVHYYDKMYPLSRANDDFYQAEITSADDWNKIAALGS